MLTFYKLNPKLLQRYQPYMNEWLREKHAAQTLDGWINGVYVRDAIGSNLSKNFRYPQEPIAFFSDSKPDDEEQTFTDADKFMAFATVFNKQFADRLPAPVKDEATSADSEEVTTGNDADE